MGCKPRHYPRRASCALFLDDNYVHQANCFSHNDIYQANSASSDNSFSHYDNYQANSASSDSFSHSDIYQANSASSDNSLSLSMIDEEIVDDDFCEWIVRELVKKYSYRYLYSLVRTDKLDN